MNIDEAIERTSNKSKLMSNNQSKEDWLQIAEWLKELKEYKDKFGDISKIDTSLYYDGFKDGYKSLYKEFKDSFEEINGLMVQYFEMWNTKVELTELEKLGLHIITIGMQDLGAFIDKGKDIGEVSF